jgi:hypothetical protein
MEQPKCSTCGKKGALLREDNEEGRIFCCENCQIEYNIMSLPDEIRFELIQYLDLKAIMRLRQTNKEFESWYKRFNINGFLHANRPDIIMRFIATSLCNRVNQEFILSCNDKNDISIIHHFDNLDEKHLILVKSFSLDRKLLLSLSDYYIHDNDLDDNDRIDLDYTFAFEIDPDINNRFVNEYNFVNNVENIYNVLMFLAKNGFTWNWE